MIIIILTKTESLLLPSNTFTSYCLGVCCLQAADSTHDRVASGRTTETPKRKRLNGRSAFHHSFALIVSLRNKVASRVQTIFAISVAYKRPA